MFLYIFIALSLISGCTTLISVPAHREPLTRDKTAAIVSDIKTQGLKVSSFYSTGKVVLRDWKWDSEADTLIAGIREPLRIKIEITHSWGRPILHFLIENGDLEILSFQEKVLYKGAYTPELLSRFLPVKIDYRLMWSVVRGYPHILDHSEVVSWQGDRISLLDQMGREIEVMDLYPESDLPRQVYLPLDQINLLFYDIMHDNGIHYAREVKVESEKAKKILILKNNRMVFNRDIPEKIFSLSAPSSFKIVNLDTD